MFCIVCGSAAVKGNYCKKHFLEKHALFRISNAVACYCKDCDSYFYKEQKFGSESALVRFLSSALTKTEHDIASFSPVHKKIANKLHINLTCIGKIRGVEKRESHDYLVFVKKQLCLNCSRKSGGYYEAVLQVRGSSAMHIYEFVMKNTHKHGITNIRNAENGFDLRLIRKSAAAALAKLLKQEGYDVHTSYKLVKEKKGQKLYRNFYVVR